VLDPGHGGVDPGAERDGVNEKQLMLSFAQTLADALRRAGAEVVLTREEDVFVALETRVAIAHQVQGDLFISLHADILTQGGAKGATVYTLSDEASDAATEHLAARHNRSDIIAGADLTGSDDQVAQVLLDLARQETGPRSAALAMTLAEGMASVGGPMNRHPLREAGFSVLKSADIPSVLIEIGFLSSDRDLANISDPVWRQGMAQGMAQAVLAWRDADAARAGLVRQ
jgi:N-acetylmuramoyl-L-alanine amidase